MVTEDSTIDYFDITHSALGSNGISYSIAASEKVHLLRIRPTDNYKCTISFHHPTGRVDVYQSINGKDLL